MRGPGKRSPSPAALLRHGLRPLAARLDGVRVWRTSLHSGAVQLSRYLALLAVEEQARAARFRFAADRRRFIVAHARLRLLLAAYTGMTAAAITFRHNRHGKPLLYGFPRLHFNLSHSGERAVFAVSVGGAVGVDIEQCNGDTKFESVARRFFTPAEFDALQGIAASRRRRAFFALWTCKEAVVKANGKGLASQLSAFEIGGFSTAKPSVTRADDPVLRRASIGTLNAGPGYAAAVVRLPETRREPSARHSVKSKPRRT